MTSRMHKKSPRSKFHRCVYRDHYQDIHAHSTTSQPKFDKNELYRRPEFEERVPDTPPPAPKEHRVKVEHEIHQPETSITYVPRHLRQEMAAAQQPQAQIPARAIATPPHGAPSRPHAHTTASGSSAMNAPVNRAPSVGVPKTSGLVTPIQTPMQAQRPPPPQPPAATSPLSRMRSAPERSVPCAEPAPAPARAGSVDAVNQDIISDGQANGQSVDEDEDPFPLSTQDDAFLATVDLGEGDLGRPIDFDEGVGGVSVMDASVPEQDSESSGVLPLPEYQVCGRAGNESSAGSSSGAPSKTGVWNKARVQPAAKPPSGSSAQGQPQSRGGPSNSTASTSTPSMSSMQPPPQDVKRPVATSMGGFHFLPGMVRLSPVLAR